MPIDWAFAMIGFFCCLVAFLVITILIILQENKELRKTVARLHQKKIPLHVNIVANEEVWNGQNCL